MIPAFFLTHFASEPTIFQPDFPCCPKKERVFARKTMEGRLRV